MESTWDVVRGLAESECQVQSNGGLLVVHRGKGKNKLGQFSLHEIVRFQVQGTSLTCVDVAMPKGKLSIHYL